MQKKKILIIDDIGLTRIMLSNIFKDDYNIWVAASGQEALNILCQKKEDWAIIFVETVMPCNGCVEFLYTKNRDLELKAVPTIIFSDSNDIYTKLSFLESSIYDVILKPIDYKNIKKHAENMLENSMQEKAEKDKLLATETELRRYKMIVEQMKVIVFDWTRGEGIKYMSQETQGYILPKIGEKAVSIDFLMQIVHKDDREVFHDYVNTLKSGETSQSIIRLKKNNGLYYYSCLRMYAKGNQNIDYVIGTIKDVDKEIKLEKELEFKGTYDFLTSFFNKLTFEEKVAEYIKLNQQDKLVIVNLDIKGFKFINDLFGFEDGDRLLKAIGEVISKLQIAVYSCRSSGDSFFLLVKYKEEDEVVKIVRRLSKNLESITTKYKLLFNFGIKFINEKEISVKELCDNASLACSMAKDNIIERIGIYDAFLSDKKARDLYLEKEMNKALSTGQFHVYLQAKYDINNNCLVGAESLVRWIHPVEGLIMPSEFIPLFEKNGFIINLDEYMWEETCKILSRWQEMGIYHIPISVNVSRVHVHNVNFVSTILGILNTYKINPTLLELELTETAYANQTNILYDMLESLKKKGVLISMDDFGTGYSSLTMLKEAPINTIKLDKAFTEDIAINVQSETIVKHLIALAKDLNMMVLAEGVEFKEQADKLRELGCDLAQGYYYKVPLCVKEFEKLLIECNNLGLGNKVSNQKRM